MRERLIHQPSLAIFYQPNRATGQAFKTKAAVKSWRWVREPLKAAALYFHPRETSEGAGTGLLK